MKIFRRMKLNSTQACIAYFEYFGTVDRRSFNTHRYDLTSRESHPPTCGSGNIEWQI